MRTNTRSILTSELLPALTHGAAKREMAMQLTTKTLRSIAVANECEINEDKVDALARVNCRALLRTGEITQLEQQVATMVPMAATRLQAIGDMGAYGLAQLVSDASESLRRI